MQTLASVQVARGIAASMVVAFHMLSIEAKYVQLKTLPSVFEVGPLGVDIFFVISGFVMMVSTENLIPSRKSILEFLRRRLVRIFPIYWFFTLLVLPVYLLAPHMVNSSQSNRVDLLRSFLLLPSDLLPLLAVGWSLVFELWFYLLFAVLLIFPRRHLPLLLVLWAGVLVACWLIAPAAGGPALRLITSLYALEFIAGCTAYYLFRMYTVQLAKWSILAGSVLLIAVASMYTSLGETVGLYRMVPTGLSVGLILSGAAAMERHGYLKWLSILAWTGDISYTVYLSHVLALSVVGRLFAAIDGNLGASMAIVMVFWIVAIVLVILTGLLSHILVEKPMSRALKPRI